MWIFKKNILKIVVEKIDIENKMLYDIKNLKERRKKIKKKKTTQDWLPFEKIFNNGIVQYKNYFIKIIKVIPINYDLKSNLEKEAILNSYKLFLKTCDFDIQIIIQSKKENLSTHINNVENFISNQKNPKIKEISEKYINYIKEKNEENKSSSKNFYIIIKNDVLNLQKENFENIEKISENILIENFFKIKESLSRCGNVVLDINSKKEVEKILMSFYNPRLTEKYF